MKSSPLIACFLALAASASFAAPSDAKDTNSPLTALIEYRDALKRADLVRAGALTASFDRLPPEYVREITKRYSDSAVAGRRLWLFPDSLRVIDDCAVIVIGDGERAFPDDPCYFLKQNGQWKVLPGFAKWQEDYIDVTAGQREAFGKLAEQYKSEKKRLREKANPGSDAK